MYSRTSETRKSSCLTARGTPPLRILSVACAEGGQRGYQPGPVRVSPPPRKGPGPDGWGTPSKRTWNQRLEKGPGTKDWALVTTDHLSNVLMIINDIFGPRF